MSINKLKCQDLEAMLLSLKWLFHDIWYAQFPTIRDVIFREDLCAWFRHVEQIAKIAQGMCGSFNSFCGYCLAVNHQLAAYIHCAHYATITPILSVIYARFQKHEFGQKITPFCLAVFNEDYESNFNRLSAI